MNNHFASFFKRFFFLKLLQIFHFLLAFNFIFFSHFYFTIDLIINFGLVPDLFEDLVLHLRLR